MIALEIIIFGHEGNFQGERENLFTSTMDTIKEESRKESFYS